LIINSSLVFDGIACSIRDMGGHATIPSEVANIAKNLIGGGVFSLSGGMAMYADSPAAVWTASLWICGLGAIFGYFCLLIAKVCTTPITTDGRSKSSRRNTLTRYFYHFVTDI
jgi:hypothetical protein